MSHRALATNGQGNGPHQAPVTPSPDLPATAKCPAARKNSPAERQDTNGGSERHCGGRGSVTCWLRDRGQLLQRARFSVCDTGGGNAASGGRRPRRRGAACARGLRSGPAGGAWSRCSSRPVLESSRKLMRRRAAAPESELRVGAAQPRPPCRPDAGEPDADGRRPDAGRTRRRRLRGLCFSFLSFPLPLAPPPKIGRPRWLALTLPHKPFPSQRIPTLDSATCSR